MSILVKISWLNHFEFRVIFLFFKEYNAAHEWKIKVNTNEYSENKKLWLKIRNCWSLCSAAAATTMSGTAVARTRSAVVLWWRFRSRGPLAKNLKWKWFFGPHFPVIRSSFVRRSRVQVEIVMPSGRARFRARISEIGVSEGFGPVIVLPTIICRIHTVN